MANSCGHCNKWISPESEQSEISACKNCTLWVHDSCINDCFLSDEPGIIVRILRAVRLVPFRCRRCNGSLPRFKSPSASLCRSCWLNLRGPVLGPPYPGELGYSGAFVENGQLQTRARTYHYGARCAHCSAHLLPFRDVETCPRRSQGMEQCDTCFASDTLNYIGTSCLSWSTVTVMCFECGGRIHSSCANYCNAPPANPDGHDWMPLGPSGFNDRLDSRYNETTWSWKCHRCYKYYSGQSGNRYGVLPPCKPKEHKLQLRKNSLRQNVLQCTKCQALPTSLDPCEPFVHE